MGRFNVFYTFTYIIYSMRYNNNSSTTEEETDSPTEKKDGTPIVVHGISHL